MKKIRLYSYQEKAKVDELLTTGILMIKTEDISHCFYALNKDVNAEFLYLYLIEKMKSQNIKNCDEKFISPVWAWYKCNGRFNPSKKHDSLYRGLYRIDFEIDRDAVLLTDFNVYSYFLVNCQTYNKKEEHDKLLNEYLQNKDNIFKQYDMMLNIDNKTDTEYTFSNRKATIQACIGKITKEMVIKITKI